MSIVSQDMVHDRLFHNTSFHLLERAVHVVTDCLDLQLLMNQFVLNLVDPDV